MTTEQLMAETGCSHDEAAEGIRRYRQDVAELAAAQRRLPPRLLAQQRTSRSTKKKRRRR